MYRPIGICSDVGVTDPCETPPQIEYPGPSICPLVSKTLKKNQIPIYDTCGPFPDESILSSIDRLLFFIGARRIQKMLGLPTPSLDECSNSSECSVNVTPELCPASEGFNALSAIPMAAAAASPSSIPPMRPPIGPPIMKKCCGCCKQSKAGSLGSTATPPFETPRGPADSGMSPGQILEAMKAMKAASGAEGKVPSLPLKRSFSLCSLACRKMKKNLSFQPPSAIGKECKWLWTRLQYSDNGCEIYEVFKNSSVLAHPSQVGANSLPHLIMVVLPNGCIMPFETITCH